MAKASFPLDGKPKRLELEWSFGWKNLTVRVDGTTVGSAATLDAPARFTLPDGRALEVALKRGMNAELQIFLAGEPLAGAANDPEVRKNVAAGVAFFIAGLNILLGALAVSGVAKFLAEIAGFETIAVGAVFIGLGIGIKKGSSAALWIAIVLFALDGIVSFGMLVAAGGTPPIAMIFVRVMLLVAMGRAIPAMKELQLRKAPLVDTAEGARSGMPTAVSVAPPDPKR